MRDHVDRTGGSPGRANRPEDGREPLHDLILVTAPPAQIAAMINELRRDSEDVLGVTVRANERSRGIQLVDAVGQALAVRGRSVVNRRIGDGHRVDKKGASESGRRAPPPSANSTSSQVGKPEPPPRDAPAYDSASAATAEAGESAPESMSASDESTLTSLGFAKRLHDADLVGELGLLGAEPPSTEGRISGQTTKGPGTEPRVQEFFAADAGPADDSFLGEGENAHGRISVLFHVRPVGPPPVPGLNVGGSELRDADAERSAP
jgi:hypothetical protein